MGKKGVSPFTLGCYWNCCIVSCSLFEGWRTELKDARESKRQIISKPFPLTPSPCLPSARTTLPVLKGCKADPGRRVTFTSVPLGKPSRSLKAFEELPAMHKSSAPLLKRTRQQSKSLWEQLISYIYGIAMASLLQKSLLLVHLRGVRLICFPLCWGREKNRTAGMHPPVCV